MLEKRISLDCGLSEGCRLNLLGVARHGGLGRAGRAPINVDSGRCSLTHKCVSLWIVNFLPDANCESKRGRNEVFQLSRCCFIYILPPGCSNKWMGLFGFWANLALHGRLLINEATGQVGGYGFGLVLSKHICFSEHTAQWRR